MEGLIEEGDKMASETAQPDVKDAGLIASAQRVEHYEIAGYGCARTYAELLGDRQGARLLNTTLREEADTDKKLTKLARSLINVKAKKAPKPAKQSDDGFTGAIKRAVAKVTGS
jgi:ferritin-like metal-binding protein YciE